MPIISSARILVLATNGFEESELFGPRAILEDSGATVHVASPTRDQIRATVLDAPGRTVDPDLEIDAVDPGLYDGLLLPGGVINPDALRTNRRAVDLVRAFARQGKPIGAICHGPWLLVEADILRGATATSWPSIRTDLRNAGAEISDERVVRDRNIVTAQAPEDVPEFTETFIRAIEARS